MSTIKVTNLRHESASSSNITLDSSGNVSAAGNLTVTGSATLNGLAYPTAGPLSNRNKIINGNMRIDQRNAGSSVTITSSGYTLDRWRAGTTDSSKFSVQQSTTAPAGFTNSLLFTSLSADSGSAGDQYGISQRIEGNNIADLAWGTSDAKSVILSFWVRSSLTGTFGGSLRNNSVNRSYPFTYAISSADTWEYKTLTVPGDTSGTWNTSTSIGILLNFGLGEGSTFSGTAGAWAAANYTGATGAVQVTATNSATWYITGVQLEVGSVATPFEHRSYGDELRRCLRYFQRYRDGITGDGGLATLAVYSTSSAYGGMILVAPMRTAPSLTSSTVSLLSNETNDTSITLDLMGASDYAVEFRVTSISYTAGHAAWLRVNSAGYIRLDAEL